MNFLSDNALGIVKEVSIALAQASDIEYSLPYGEDELTKRAENLVKKILNAPEAEVFFVMSGTAANALAISSACRSYSSVFCSDIAHILTTEANAVEFFSGGASLSKIKSNQGLIDPVDLALACEKIKKVSFHSSKPAVLSLTQSSECGTVYTESHLRELVAIAKEAGLKVHIDGARLLNAAIALNTSLENITTKMGIDMLSFGTSKAGTMNADMVVFFDKDLARDFKFRLKQSGHVLSKGRFFAVQILAFLANDVWKKHTIQANNMSLLLARLISEQGLAKLFYPVETNQAFIELTPSQVKKIKDKGYLFHFWAQNGENQVCRFVCSFQTTKDSIINLANDMRI